MARNFRESETAIKAAIAADIAELAIGVAAVGEFANFIIKDAAMNPGRIGFDALITAAGGTLILIASKLLDKDSRDYRTNTLNPQTNP